MRTLIVLFGLALAVWAFCGAIMGVGRAVTTLEITLAVHLVGAPLGAALAAWAFYRLDGGAEPWAVAATFVGAALMLDAMLVAPVFEKSFDMFGSLIGLWIPQVLIFLAAWSAGIWAQRRAMA